MIRNISKFSKQLFRCKQTILNSFDKSNQSQYKSQAPGQRQQNKSYSFDIINHYEQICKCRGQGGSVSILPCYPQFQLANQGAVAVRMKYSKNFIYLWRFQLNDSSKDSPNKESLNFPISYDNCAQLLELAECYRESPKLVLEESTVKGNLTLTINVEYSTKKVGYQLHLLQKEGGEQKYNIEISVPQFRLLSEQMKQGLPIVTGWQIPNKFLNEIQKQQYNSPTTSNTNTNNE